MGYPGRRLGSVAREAEPDPDPHPTPRIVVLADDVSSRREACARDLQAGGIWAAGAPTAAEAARAVTELKPDVIAAVARFVTGPAASPSLTAAIRKLSLTRPARTIVFDAAVDDDHPDDYVALPAATSSPVLAAMVQELLREQAGNRASTTVHTGRTPGRTKPFPRDATPQAGRATRRCPACSRPLAWIENGHIGGVSYEYFHWCASGCGLYCFDCDARQFVKLS